MDQFKQDLLERYGDKFPDKKKPFKVIKRLSEQEITSYTSLTKSDTEHITFRVSRLEAYKDLNLTSSVIIDGFEVDKQHPHGNEIHLITSTGLIYIYNAISNRFITVLGARPGQLKRYYLDLKIRWSTEINALIKQAEVLVRTQNINNK